MKKLTEMSDKELAEYCHGLYPGENKTTGSMRLAAFVVITMIILFITVVVFIALTLLSTSEARAAEIVDMEIISRIESRGNPLAVSPVGARGEYQVMPCVLQEYNQFHKVKFSWGQMFDHRINRQVASWYLNVRIPQLLVHYHKPVNTRNVIIAYNAGVRAVVKGYLPKETRAYLVKYNRMKGASRG